MEVKSGGTAAYRSLRMQVEKFDEATAMPCVRRASELLEKAFDGALLLKLMEFAVLYSLSRFDK